VSPRHFQSELSPPSYHPDAREATVIADRHLNVGP
jgi:hypothetical protein